MTKIEWTDVTWNPIVGCSVVSPGCTNCYAMKMAARHEAMSRAQGRMSKYASLTRPTKAGPVWTGRVELEESALDLPLRWKKPRRIFVNSMSDLFHEALHDEAIDRVFAVMANARHHTFQVLTKRPDRMKAYLSTPDRVYQIFRAIRDHIDSEYREGSRFDDETPFPWPLPNVWLGVSVEDQARADERIPLLLETPAAVRFISAEPLLGPVDLRHVAPNDNGGYINALSSSCGPNIDWVITGAESGRGARPCNIEWVRSLKDQCQAAGVPFFYKQAADSGRKIPTPELDGRKWVEFPR